MLNYTTYPVEHKGRFHHVMVSHAEHAIHLGAAFTALVWEKLAAAGYIDVLMVVPSGYRCHFNYSITSGLEAKLEVFADSVVTGGTTRLARNRNEESSNTNTVALTIGGTLSAAGTLLAEYAWGTTAIPAVGPAQGGDNTDEEIMWPQNVIRRFRLTSLADANNVTLRLNFIMEEMIPEEL